MDAYHLEDRLHWGLNRVANVIGRDTEAFRPKGLSSPLHQSNRYLRLPAAFSRADGNFNQPMEYGDALWRGYFDAAYTRVGDYLVQDKGIWFVVAQARLLPILCVKANTVISVVRPTSAMSPTDGSANDVACSQVVSRWPASWLGIHVEGRSPTRLPGDTAIPTSIVLLPAVHGRILLPTDIITDSHGNSAMVIAAELGDFGWRLNIRRITT
jgi:hypothetical protein